MNAKHLAVIAVFTIVIPSMSVAFAQEYVPVGPVFLKDQSDSCSKLEQQFPGGVRYDSWANHVAIHFMPDMGHNYTRTTMIGYNGTKFLVTLNDYNQAIYNNYPVNTLVQSPDYIVQKTHTITLDKFTNVTIAMANVGNKSTNLYDFVYSMLVINRNDGTHVATPMTAPVSVMGEPINPIMEWATYEPLYLLPGQAIGSSKSFPMHGYVEEIWPGNYTISAVMALLGDVNGTCTRVFLWSQPVDLVVPGNAKSPEFPFAGLALLIGIASTVVLYGAKFKR